MAHYFEFDGDINFNRIGRRASVADDDIARCMYYLKCVCTVVEYDDDDMERYTDYENYEWLSENERRYVFLLCLTFRPDELEDKVFFENSALCEPGSSNEFYEVTQVRHHLMTVHSIIIAGQNRQVKRVMAYERSWMQSNYYEPMQRLTYEFSPQRRRQAPEQLQFQRVQSDACTIS